MNHKFTQPSNSDKGQKTMDVRGFILFAAARRKGNHVSQDPNW